MKTVKSIAKIITIAIIAMIPHITQAVAMNPVLKIGLVGVLSGPDAAWGFSNLRSLETRASWINEMGGIKIGDTTYDIEIVSFDDKRDPQLAIAGMKKMAELGINYVVGPHVFVTANAVRPIAEENNIIYFPFAFPKKLYEAPTDNAIFGMIANYQSGPVIYKYLRDNRGVKTAAFISANEADPINQRNEGAKAAKALGIKVVSSDLTYENNATDFTPFIKPIVEKNPDLLVLPDASPANAPKIIRAARELGFKGIISSESSHDANLLREGAGDLANGFISVGGASSPDIVSDEMQEFVRRYIEMFGEYNDESNTKVYALEYILETLKANPKAIDDVEEFKKTIKTFEAPNIFLKGDAKLHYTGQQSFGQQRQLAVPLVVLVYMNGNFETLFIDEVS